MPGEPRQFGPYRLFRRLGVGGMAETFEAVRRGQGGFEQRVCLKRVLPAYSQDPDFNARFRKEANVAAQLRHTNIVGITDFGDVDGVSYMALELVDGVDLRSLLKSLPEQRLAPDMVTLIGLDLAYALEHAHQSIVHRDVSASNVLISRSGDAKLADFGIAKAIEATATASKSVQGKVPYMAPEQMRGEAVDPRSDLFSLGVVLFEAVAGVRPFDGAHEVETMHRIVEGRHVTLEEVAPTVPLAFRTVVERLIANAPGERTRSASQLIDELSALGASPHARRELASMVEERRGGPETRLHVRLPADDPDTELSPAADVPGSTRRDIARHPHATRRRRYALLAMALLLAAVGLVAVESLGGRTVPSDKGTGDVSEASSPSPQTNDENQGEAALGAQPVIGIDTPAAEEAQLNEAPQASTQTPGWVTVVVQPWGNVWIDGVWQGRAPVRARLDKGRHVVEAGRDFPSKRRVIRVESGARKHLEMSLED